MGNLRIYFTESDPAPANGYRVRYKKTGDANLTTLVPNATTSPAIITGADELVSYEGTLQTDCSNGVYSAPVTFTVDPCIGENLRVVGEECETGIRVNISSVDNGDGNYTCSYRYEWSNGEHGPVYFETSPFPCSL